MKIFRLMAVIMMIGVAVSIGTQSVVAAGERRTVTSLNNKNLYCVMTTSNNDVFGVPKERTFGYTPDNRDMIYIKCKGSGARACSMACKIATAGTTITQVGAGANSYGTKYLKTLCYAYEDMELQMCKDVAIMYKIEPLNN